tara:strand:- start:811 stop:1410 length:600 start_codon:yes stop_codon:yes gene_type:complete
MYDVLFILIGLIGGYCLGSIPFGLIFGNMAGLGDIRKIGSGNIGATNVLRTGRKDLALLTLICDSGKGALSVALMLMLSPYAAIGAAIGSVAGHMFPVWLKFQGGKGVATTLGVLLVLIPFVGILTCATWLVTALVFRFSSLAALVAVLVSPLYAGMMYNSPVYSLVTLILAILIVYKHRANIDRLMHGAEPKIGDKKK